MSIEKSNSEKPSAHTDDYYEAIASQEEEYLEEGVEKLRERELLISEATATNVRRAEAHAGVDIEHAEEELIAGDADDPPLSDDGVETMLKKASSG